MFLGLGAFSGRLFAEDAQVKTHSDYREAMAMVTASDRDNPEIKAAVDAVLAIQVVNRGKLEGGVDVMEIEEAQLNLELVMLKHAKVRRPGAKDILEQRQQEIVTRLSGIGEERKRKRTK